ncbi:ATP-binding protein [Rhizobium johnstonii]|uniref:ATP-binding protein n=1 Tax=Rhizobium johnstonii TaxID=3019933 RepID=UPI003F951CBB
MGELLPRHLETELEQALISAKVVNIVGPRQVGKTTLVRDLLKTGNFITLDDENVLAALEADPKGQLDALIAEMPTGPLIIDEAQRSKKLALAIKRTVDENRKMGQFVLTGSSNIFTSSQVADSLAGRVQTMTMLPLSMAEARRMGPARVLDWASAEDGPNPAALSKPEAMSRADYIEMILAGGFPEIQNLEAPRRRRRYRDYIDSVVERDVADVLKIRKSDSMRRLIDQLAARVGNELNVESLCKQFNGVQRKTIESYMDILTKLSLLKRLPAWTSGETGRDIRHPKVHLVDTGIAAALRSINSQSFNIEANPTALGGLFENFVHNELAKSLPFQKQEWRLYHWRYDKGREIDIIAEADGTIVGFEMKTSTVVEENDFRHLRWFRDDGPGKTWSVIGIVVYMGERLLSFGKNMYALPLSAFWSFPE